MDKAVLTIPKASVPGDLITDLHTAGLAQEPLWMKNFKDSSLWTDNVWTYSKQFTVPAGPGVDVLVWVF